jgi:hypothetical protein
MRSESLLYSQDITLSSSRNYFAKHREDLPQKIFLDLELSSEVLEVPKDTKILKAPKLFQILWFL